MWISVPLPLPLPSPHPSAPPLCPTQPRTTHRTPHTAYHTPHIGQPQIAHRTNPHAPCPTYYTLHTPHRTTPHAPCPCVPRIASSRSWLSKCFVTLFDNVRRILPCPASCIFVSKSSNRTDSTWSTTIDTNTSLKGDVYGVYMGCLEGV